MTKEIEKDILEIFGETHRVTILFDGKEILGASVTLPRPQNDEEMLFLLKQLVAVHEAPDVPDPDVLGKYSP